MNMSGPESPQEMRLESWKEIGAYLHRNVVTARRWEKEEGLPVHRHSHKSRSSVYAYPSEIDQWRASRRVPAELEVAPLWRTLFAPRSLALAVMTLVCLTTVGSGVRSASAQQLTPRLLCTQCGDYEANISPDGRWLVFSDYTTGDLVLRDLVKGQSKRLMAKTGSFKDSPAIAEEPVLSPDLRQVAYLWTMADRNQLRVIANEPSGTSRVLLEGASDDITFPVAWSSDGKSVLTGLEKKPDRATQFAWVSAARGAVKIVKSLHWRYTNGVNTTDPKVSPDGRFIAYAARAADPSQSPPVASDPKDTHIYVLAADGSTETELIKTAGQNVSPLWTPDGKHILFISDRTGRNAVWSVAVENGKAAGAPILVNSNLGDGYPWPIAVTRNGSYDYVLDREGLEQITIASIDGSGRKTAGKDRIESFVGLRPAWSPDGKSLAFKRHHLGNPNAYDLVVHSVETGDERTYPTSLGFTGFWTPGWYSDGKAILTGLGGSQPAKPGYYRVDIASGEWKQITAAERAPMAISADDKTHVDIRPDAIVAIDVAAGTEKKILPVDPDIRWIALALSPDGRTLAIWRTDMRARKTSLATIGMDGSNYRELYNPKFSNSNPGRFAQLAWTRDGQTILFDRPREVDAKNPASWTTRPHQIMRIPAQGGTPGPTGIETEGTLVNMDISPDGSRIAYSSFSAAQRIHELWSLGNVLSALH